MSRAKPAQAFLPVLLAVLAQRPAHALKLAHLVGDGSSADSRIAAPRELCRREFFQPPNLPRLQADTGADFLDLFDRLRRRAGETARKKDRGSEQP